MYDRRVCTGDDKAVNDALESFPSGHSTAGWAGLFFLALYLNAQLKVMSAHNPAYWKMILLFSPILGATLISGALTIDECMLSVASLTMTNIYIVHNWYDVLAGAIIGICTALVAFRQTFAAIFDFRFNHILLPRATSLFMRVPVTSASQSAFFGYALQSEFTSVDLPFTREGGWGFGGEAYVGAPGDATAIGSGGRGMGVGGGVLGQAEAGHGIGPKTNGHI